MPWVGVKKRMIPLMSKGEFPPYLKAFSGGTGSWGIKLPSEKGMGFANWQVEISWDFSDFSMIPTGKTYEFHVSLCSV